MKKTVQKYAVTEIKAKRPSLRAMPGLVPSTNEAFGRNFEFEKDSKKGEFTALKGCTRNPQRANSH